MKVRIDSASAKIVMHLYYEHLVPMYQTLFAETALERLYCSINRVGFGGSEIPTTPRFSCSRRTP